MKKNRRTMHRRMALGGAFLMLFAILTGCNQTGGSSCPLSSGGGSGNTAQIDSSDGGGGGGGGGGEGGSSSGSGGGGGSGTLASGNGGGGDSSSGTGDGSGNSSGAGGVASSNDGGSSSDGSSAGQGGTQIASATNGSGPAGVSGDGSQGAVWDLPPPGSSNLPPGAVPAVYTTYQLPDGTVVSGNPGATGENTNPYAVDGGATDGTDGNGIELVSTAGSGGKGFSSSGWQSPGGLVAKAVNPSAAQVGPDGITLATNGDRAVVQKLVSPASSDPTLSANVSVQQFPTKDAPWSGDSGSNNAAVRLGAGFGTPNGNGIPPYAVSYVVVPSSAGTPAPRNYTQSYFPLDLAKTQVHEVYVPADQAANFSRNPAQDFQAGFPSAGTLPLTELYVSSNSNHHGTGTRASVGNLQLR